MWGENLHEVVRGFLHQTSPTPKLSVFHGLDEARKLGLHRVFEFEFRRSVSEAENLGTHMTVIGTGCHIPKDLAFKGYVPKAKILSPELSDLQVSKEGLGGVIQGRVLAHRT